MFINSVNITLISTPSVIISMYFNINFNNEGDIREDGSENF